MVVEVLAYLVNRAAFKTLHLFLLIHFVSFSAWKNIVAAFSRRSSSSTFSALLPSFVGALANSKAKGPY